MGMGLTFFGVLRSSEWGWSARPRAVPRGSACRRCLADPRGSRRDPAVHGAHPASEAADGEPLVTPSLFGNRQMTSGLIMFFFQFVVMMGVFFVVPLYLSVALGLSAIDTGIKITPLSLSMLLAAIGIPSFFPSASPRRVVTIGLVAMVVGIVLLPRDGRGCERVDVTWPMLLIGLGMGGLASQLGAVTVSSVPDEQSPEVGGLQNTASQFGASLGTALAGSILIAALTSSFLRDRRNPDVPQEVASQANVELASGIPFISDDDLGRSMSRRDAGGHRGRRRGERGGSDRRTPPSLALLRPGGDRVVLHEASPRPTTQRHDRGRGLRLLGCS